MKDVETGKTSQCIFGPNNSELQYFITRGWSIERFAEGLSLNQQNYAALPEIATVGNAAIREACELGAAELKKR